MRQFSYLLLAACLCLPVVGCGGEAADAPAATPPATDTDAGSGTAEEGSATAEEGEGAEASEEAASE